MFWLRWRCMTHFYLEEKNFQLIIKRVEVLLMIIFGAENECWRRRSIAFPDNFIANLIADWNIAKNESFLAQDAKEFFVVSPTHSCLFDLNTREKCKQPKKREKKLKKSGRTTSPLCIWEHNKSEWNVRHHLRIDVDKRSSQNIMIFGTRAMTIHP